MKKRPIFNQIKKRISEPRKFIQVLLGPRQTGKTTLVNQLEKELNIPTYYISADNVASENLTWLEMHWNRAREKMTSKGEGLLIIDEVQKIPSWSDMIKRLWDNDTRDHIPLKALILGSSPWLMQKGLSETLTGRFEIIPVTHWSFFEMQNSFNWDLDQYLIFGGYPGPVSLANKKNFQRWTNYINDSLIETTISRDILLMTQINKPILLRRLFQLGCNYSSQILSYQKMIGQLQDAGNTTTLAHYLELLSGAGLIGGLHKFTNKKIRSRSSSPKLQVYNTALITAQAGKTLDEIKEDSEFLGHLVESAVGAHLLNEIRGTQIKLYYWREENQEVDFVLERGKNLLAIEVKSSKKKGKLSGMNLFSKKYPQARTLLIGRDGMLLDKFLKTPVKQLI